MVGGYSSMWKYMVQMQEGAFRREKKNHVKWTYHCDSAENSV